MTVTTIEEKPTTLNGSSDSERARADRSSDASPLDTHGPAIDLKELIEAGAHFGHQTQRWNPKMRPFIYGARNGIHIINLDHTVGYFTKAYRMLVERVARGGNVLFVGTKRQAAEVVEEEATRSKQFFVNGRWLGGTLTNFQTIKSTINRLRELESMVQDGTYNSLQKKEVLRLERERQRLEKYFRGIKDMNGLPAAIFIIDPKQEHIAVREGRRLGVPIIAITDTNCDPDQIDYPIPANDDAVRAVRLITARIADACIEGLERRRSYGAENYGGGQQQQGGDVAVEYARGRASGTRFSSERAARWVESSGSDN